MDSGLILAIITKLIEYGPGAVHDISIAMKKDNFTIADIEGLYITKDPEEYFKEPEGGQ